MMQIRFGYQVIKKRELHERVGRTAKYWTRIKEVIHRYLSLFTVLIYHTHIIMENRMAIFWGRLRQEQLLGDSSLKQASIPRITNTIRDSFMDFFWGLCIVFTYIFTKTKSYILTTWTAVSRRFFFSSLAAFLGVYGTSLVSVFLTRRRNVQQRRFSRWCRKFYWFCGNSYYFARLQVDKSRKVYHFRIFIWIYVKHIRHGKTVCICRKTIEEGRSV